MLNEIGKFRAKSEAAYQLIRELLLQSIGSDGIGLEAAGKVLDYLKNKQKRDSAEAVDLNEIFRFVLYGRYVLVIPRNRFGENDFLIFKDLHPGTKLNAKLIEIDGQGFKTEAVYLPGYLRRCLKRGLHREHF